MLVLYHPRPYFCEIKCQRNCGQNLHLGERCCISLLLLFIQEDQGIYQQKVQDMISNNEIRLVVNINDLRKKNPKRTQRWSLWLFDKSEVL